MNNKNKIFDKGFLACALKPNSRRDQVFKNCNFGRIVWVPGQVLQKTISIPLMRSLIRRFVPFPIFYNSPTPTLPTYLNWVPLLAKTSLQSLSASKKNYYSMIIRLNPRSFDLDNRDGFKFWNKLKTTTAQRGSDQSSSITTRLL